MKEQRLKNKILSREKLKLVLSFILICFFTASQTFRKQYGKLTNQIVVKL